MRIFKHLSSENKNSSTIEVELDEYDTFHSLLCQSYEIHINSDEQKHVIDEVNVCIITALRNEIDAYCASSRANRFSLCGNQVVTSTDTIIAFSTTDSDKYDILDDIVVDLINNVKSKLDKIKDKSESHKK